MSKNINDETHHMDIRATGLRNVLQPSIFSVRDGVNVARGALRITPSADNLSEGEGQRAKGEGQRAKGEGQRAKGKGLRVSSGNENHVQDGFLAENRIAVNCFLV
jgi:hypothetical protein